MEAKSATVTLSHRNNNNIIFKRGDLVKVKHVHKRVWGKIAVIHSSNSFTMKAVYRPSPKSNLNNKSLLSKHKGEIVKLKTN